MNDPSNKPVVLHTRVVTGSGGGPDKTILNSPRFLDSLGYESLCAYMHPPDDPGFDQLRFKAAEQGAELIAVPDRGIWDLRVVTRMLRICRERRVNIWHGHDYKSNVLGWLLKRCWPMHLVSTVHGWGVHTGRAPLYYKIDRFALARYEKVICVSPDLQDTCIAAGVAENRCTLIENAIDLSSYQRTQTIEEAKRKLGIPPERFLIGAVGRLSAEKGFDLLIRAVDQLLSRGWDVSLLIAGDGDQRDELEQLVSEFGREERIKLLGFQADPFDLYQAMDVYVLSSLREGLPNVLLEAMATGVPVVATRVAGVPRLVDDERNGLVVTPGDVGQLITATERLIQEPDTRKRLAQAGQQTVESRYCFAQRMQQIAAVYDEVLNRVGRERPLAAGLVRRVENTLPCESRQNDFPIQ